MDYGGTERVVAFQARGLHEKGHDVTIFTPVNDRKIFADVIQNDIQIKPWWHTIPALKLKRTINRLLHFWLGGSELKQFDVLIAHNQPAPYAAYKNKKKNGKPYIVYCHAPWRRIYPRQVDLSSGWASDYREKLMFLRQGYWRRIDKESILGADAHLVNSLKIMAETKQVYGVDTKLCYPGIDVPKYRDFPELEVEKVTEKYHLNKYTLLIVGRHAPQKKLEWVPEIVKRVGSQVSEVEAIITGKPNSLVTPKLVAEANRLGVKDKIRMVDVVPESELISLYHSCPVLVYNAVYEDFGLPPIEAMACGCVPVAWNEGAGPSETIVDKETGLLAKPYDLDDFAEKVTYLLENPSERVFMANKGIKSVAKYDWRSHINILEETIQQVIK
jgi:glycosyltransferase involved in cell wall biosynthesis